jgi:hypothetical protein
MLCSVKTNRGGVSVTPSSSLRRLSHHNFRHLQIEGQEAIFNEYLEQIADVLYSALSGESATCEALFTPLCTPSFSLLFLQRSSSKVDQNATIT